MRKKFILLTIIVLLPLLISFTPGKSENRYVATVSFHDLYVIDNRESGDAEISISVQIESSLEDDKSWGIDGGFVCRIEDVGDDEEIVFIEDVWDGISTSSSSSTLFHTNRLSYGDKIVIWIWENDISPYDYYNSGDDELLYQEHTITASTSGSITCFSTSDYIYANYSIHLVKLQ